MAEILTAMPEPTKISQCWPRKPLPNGWTEFSAVWAYNPLHDHFEITMNKTLPIRNRFSGSILDFNEVFAATPYLVVLMFSLFSIWLYTTHSQSLEIRGVEQNVIYFIQRAMKTGQIYGPLDEYPFNVNQYTPLYLHIVSGIANVFGLEPNAVSKLYILARSVSLCLSLGIVLLVYRIMRRHYQVTTFYAGFAGSLAFVGLFPWSFIARSDSLYLLLAVAGFAFNIRFLRNRRLFDHVVSIVLILLAYMAKQTAVMWVVIIGVNCLMFLDWRRFVNATIVAVTIAITFFLAVWLIYGTALFEHTIDGVKNGIDVKSMIRKAYIPFVSSFYINLAVFAGFFLYAWRRGGESERALSLATGLTLVIGATLALKWGSAINYFNEFIILSSICGGLWIDRLTSQKTVISGGPARFFTAAYLVCFSIGFAAANIRTIDEIRYDRQYERLLRVANIVKNDYKDAGYIFTIDTYGLALPLVLPERVIAPQWRVTADMVVVGAYDLQSLKTFMEKTPGGVAVSHRDICDAIQAKDVSQSNPTNMKERTNKITLELLQEFEFEPVQQGPVQQGPGWCILQRVLLH